MFEKKGREHPWNAQDYLDLRKLLEALPQGSLRDQALDHLRSLDCANRDRALASCDSSHPPSPEAVAWRKSLEDARVDDAAYGKALAAALKTLICSGANDAVYILRGALGGSTYGRLWHADTETTGLINFIMNKDCPVSSVLTDDDKASLLRLKGEAIRGALTRTAGAPQPVGRCTQWAYDFNGNRVCVPSH